MILEKNNAPHADMPVSTLTPVIIALPGNESMAQSMAAGLGAAYVDLHIHHFPDGETSLRIATPEVIAGHDVLLVCTLNQPDEKLAMLLFAAELARDLGAARIILIAPYLAYMRQDKRFNPGESITAHYFPRLLSRYFDGLITIDPHLHRITSLEQIYAIPCRVIHAAETIGQWVRTHIPHAALIGPDEESAQWVAEVARHAEVPYTVLRKIRHGDLQVEVSVPDVPWLSTRTPVIVDDIASSARTLIAASEALIKQGSPAPVCIVIHALFAGDALPALHACGVRTVASCNTIPHLSNAIALDAALIEAAYDMLHTLPFAPT